MSYSVLSKRDPCPSSSSRRRLPAQAVSKPSPSAVWFGRAYASTAFAASCNTSPVFVLVYRCRYILEKHGGKLPMRIRAVPEGTVLGPKNVLFSVENTDPECFWLCTWFETLLVQCWYPMTVATQSREQKRVIRQYLDATADNIGKLGFMLHDFGFRGVSSCESAAIGGAAHLVNFVGTDTVAALVAAREVYGLPSDSVAGYSIPASEHSTITSWGPGEEKDAFENILSKFPTGLVACVSDSYNIWEACTKLWGTQLKDKYVLSAALSAILCSQPDHQRILSIVAIFNGSSYLMGL